MNWRLLLPAFFLFRRYAEAPDDEPEQSQQTQRRHFHFELPPDARVTGWKIEAGKTEDE